MPNRARNRWRSDSAHTDQRDSDDAIYKREKLTIIAGGKITDTITIMQNDREGDCGVTVG